MYVPLSYQKSEYDCGPTTLLNAISVLFERETIPPDVVKHIMIYSIDAYNDKGEFGKSGTSQMAMMFLSSWLNQFGKVKHFPIHCDFYTGEEVSLAQNSRIMAGLQLGGTAVSRVWFGVWHYVLLTGVEDGTVFLFDPYYRTQPFKNKKIELITDEIGKANRRLPIGIMNSEYKKPYAFGPLKTRETVMLFNMETQKTLEKTV